MENFNQGLGCLPAKKDYRDYKICSVNAAVSYPETFVLTNLPKVKNQLNINSCCAHATSSILEYHDKSRHNLSTNFIYGIQKQECKHDGMGMYLADACKIVQKYGDMLEEDCRGNNEVPVCWSIAENALTDTTAKQEAYNYRISAYYNCSTDNDIKYALMNYGPVLGAVDWRNRYTLDSDAVINFDKTSQGGGHAVMVYGWNKKGWLIQNSWGTKFGNKGTFILPFEYGLREARALVDFENTEDNALYRPFNNRLINVFYKIVNKIANFIRGLH